MTRLHLSFGLVLLLACTHEVGPEGDPTAPLASESSDPCERDARYGDGACDVACALPDPDCGASPLAGRASAGVCVGIRGNGPRITSHFGALGRITEDHGLLSAVAGGSSGSISSFLVESVQMNPQVRCTGCSTTTQALRASLLFKSLQGYFEALQESEEGLALQTTARIAQRIREDGVRGLLRSNPREGVRALRALLTSEDLTGLVNPETLRLLRDSPNPVHHARDLVDSVTAGLSFSAADPGIFVRPGVVDFAHVAELLGRIGDFYAGYGPGGPERLERFLQQCAPRSRGRVWSEIAELPLGGSTCGAHFRDVVATFRARRESATGPFRSRIDEPVGAHMPVLVTTAVLQGEAVRAHERARADYLAARDIRWSVDFDDVRFGYWGQAGDLGLLMANPAGFTDRKTRMRTSLGEARWRDVLQASPAEPGLARAVELPDGRLSVGGWSDHYPVQALRNIGCETVITLTRRGGRPGFTWTTSELLGMNEAQGRELYDTTRADSGYGAALVDADGVWCTNWDAPPMGDLDAMQRDGWSAPLQTRAPRLAGAANATPRVGLPGCTVGVGEGEYSPFSDVEGHVAEAEILALRERGVIAGYPDGTFGPDRTVTRAELAAMLREAFLGDRPASGAPFSDVPPSHWAHEAVAVVRGAGFMSGYPDGTFRPSARVSRQEVLVALSAGRGYRGGSEAALRTFYPDVDAVGRWAIPGVAAADAAGLLENDALHRGRLRPTAPATRADVASLLFYALP